MKQDWWRWEVHGNDRPPITYNALNLQVWIEMEQKETAESGDLLDQHMTAWSHVSRQSG